MKANSGGGGWSNSVDHAAAGYMIPTVSAPFTTKPYADNEAQEDKLIPTVSLALTASMGRLDATAETLIPTTAHTLRGEGFDASEDGTGRGTPLIPVIGLDADYNGNVELLNAIKASGQGAIQCGAVAFQFKNGGGAGMMVDQISATIGASRNGEGAVYVPRMGVRRLTPRECERLQGAPDDMTRWGRREDGTTYELKDSPRYKMAGNGCTCTVVSWIGRNLLEAVGGEG